MLKRIRHYTETVATHRAYLVPNLIIPRLASARGNCVQNTEMMQYMVVIHHFICHDTIIDIHCVNNSVTTIYRT